MDGTHDSSSAYKNENTLCTHIFKKLPFKKSNHLELCKFPAIPVTVILVAVAACSSGGQQFILTNSDDTLVNEAAWELREIVNCAMRDLFLNNDKRTWWWQHHHLDNSYLVVKTAFVQLCIHAWQLHLNHHD